MFIKDRLLDSKDKLIIEEKNKIPNKLPNLIEGHILPNNSKYLRNKIRTHSNNQLPNNNNKLSLINHINNNLKNNLLTVNIANKNHTK